MTIFLQCVKPQYAPAYWLAWVEEHGIVTARGSSKRSAIGGLMLSLSHLVGSGVEITEEGGAR